MELLDQLREDSLKKVLPLSLALLAAGVALYFIFGCYNLVKLAVPRDLAGMSPETLENAWVEGDVAYFHVKYAQEMAYRDGRPFKVTGAQYVIKFDSEHYVGLAVHQDALDEAEEMMRACTDYYNGLLPEDGIPVMHVKGAFRKMDDETLRFYRAAAGGDKGMEEIMYPYYIDAGRLGGWPVPVIWIVLALSFLLVVAGLVPGIWALTGGFQRKLCARAAEMGEMKRSMDRVWKFYEETEPVGGVRLRSDYILFQDGAGSLLCRPWEVSWAYDKPVWPLLHGGKPCILVFCMTDGKKHAVPMKEREAKLLMESIEDEAPGVVLGYTKDKERSYRGDPTFASRWEAILPGCSGRR